MKRPKNPTVWSWVNAFGLIFLSMFCIGTSLLPKKPTPQESELTPYEGVPTNVVAREEYSLRGGHRRKLNFTVAGMQMYYANYSHRYQEVLDAVQRGKPVQAWLGPNKTLYKLTCGNEVALDYATAAADQQSGKDHAFVGGFFYGIPFFLLGTGLVVWLAFQRRAYLASQQAPELQVIPAGPVSCECTGCGRKVRVAEQLFGRKVKCPGCGQTFVAQPDAFKDLDLAEASVQGSRNWQIALLVAAVCSFLFVGCVGGFIMFGVRAIESAKKTEEDSPVAQAPKPKASNPLPSVKVPDRAPPKTQRTEPKPEKPQPEKPQPEKPQPEKPQPEKPQPEKPRPEKPKDPLPDSPPQPKGPPKEDPKRPTPAPDEPKPQTRLSVPKDADQARAEKEIRELFKDEYASKKVANRLAFGKKLLEQARETRNDPASQYVLFREARDISARAGDLAQAWQAVDEMAKVFEVNAPALKLPAVEAVATRATSAAANETLVPALFPVVEEALALDDFDTADRLIQLAAAAARKAKSIPLRSSTTALAKRSEALRTAHADVKKASEVLAKDPTDAAANLTVGKYLCFFKGNWDKGLPMLALGSDEKLKALATRDLAAPEKAAERADVANGWYEFAASVEPPARKLLQQRALHWYGQAVDDLTGLAKIRAEKRIEELQKIAEPGTPAAGWIVIFRSKDPSIWGKKVSSAAGLAVPLDSVPNDIQYLRLTNMSTRDHVIIRMTREKLAGGNDDGTIGWNGDNVNKGDAYHLGISRADWRIEKGSVGQIAVRARTFKSWRGWGFGNVFKTNGRQAYSWAGNEIAPAVFEIAVKAGKLNAAEAKKVLTVGEK